MNLYHRNSIAKRKKNQIKTNGRVFWNENNSIWRESISTPRCDSDRLKYRKGCEHRHSRAKKKYWKKIYCLHCPAVLIWLFIVRYCLLSFLFKELYVRIEPGVGRWQRPMLPLHQQCGETGTALQTLRFVRCHVSCVGNEILSIYINKYCILIMENLFCN